MLILKKFPVIFFDIISIVLAWYAAFVLLNNLIPYAAPLLENNALQVFAILLPLQIVSFYLFKTYRGIWRFFSLNDVTRIMKAVCYPNFALIPISYWFGLPHAIFPVFSLCLIGLLCTSRAIYKHYYNLHITTSADETEQKNILIIGAGFSGEQLCREIKQHRNYHLIGFLDDNPKKIGLDIHGYQVLGTSHDLNKINLNQHIDLIIIAIPSARSIEMRRIVNLCEATKIQFRTLPSLSALVSKHVDINNLRNVSLEDLLGRDEVPVIDEDIAPHIKNARIIVTGGGGSIGSELCRQILKYQPSSLLIIDNCEFNLYSIHQELSALHNNIEISLTSITDETLIAELFQKFKPDIVFHAAAFKHVPLLEKQGQLAIKNNIFGTQIIATASVNAMAKKFIFISTDKAVNPTNIMGATKRIAELYCQNLNNKVATQFITVRFGNVLGSAGSVVPLFQKQLQSGGPITVTHPEIERFFMTIPEASQLILQAMSNGHGGEIFVLDMGSPVKITYLAEQMIRLVNKEPNVDINIEFTGLRPGEKMYEELFYQNEFLIKTEHQKLFKANHSEIDWDEYLIMLNTLQQFYLQSDDEQIKTFLQQAVFAESQMV